MESEIAAFGGNRGYLEWGAVLHATLWTAVVAANNRKAVKDYDGAFRLLDYALKTACEGYQNSDDVSTQTRWMMLRPPS